MYSLIYDEKNTQLKYIFRSEDNAYIPLDPENNDYQLYLKWVEEGNEPIKE